MASAELNNVLELLKSRPQDANASIERRRAGLEKVSERVAKDVQCQAVTAGSVPAEWVDAPGAASDRVILYLHGGGYVMGSPHSHRAMVARIGRTAQARILLIDYRLAPEHPFPAAVEDATAAYRWLLSQGYKPAKIAIGGDSAGGGLALAALLSLRDAKTAMPAAAVAISPWTDLEGTGESMKTNRAADPMANGGALGMMGANYVGKNDIRNPLISPVYGDYQGIPPLLIQVGGVEVLLDDSTRVAEKAKQAGVKVELEIWPEMIHVWHAFAKILPEGEQAIARIGEFVLAHT